MKKYIVLLAIIVSGISYGQVIIGNTVGTATDKTNVLLDFKAGENKGLILPYNTTLPTTPAEGSIILDATTATNAKVKYYNGTGWQDLSGGAAAADVSGALTVQSTATQNNIAKTIIGATNSTADGVLVLESATKAMILPIVASTDNIVNPAPGMMVFVDGPKKLVAVFNGTQWSYWE